MADKSMSKAALIARIADKSGATSKTVSEILSALEDVVRAEVIAGNAITLPGIGKISVRARAARTARNPATGTPIEKPADRAVRIAAVKALKDALSD